MRNCDGSFLGDDVAMGGVGNGGPPSTVELEASWSARNGGDAKHAAVMMLDTDGDGVVSFEDLSRGHGGWADAK